MSWTKRQFVEAAFDEIGLASYVYDLQPEQLQSALRRLDAMMATWNNKGIRVGYPLPSSPEDSDLDVETGVPDAANEAIYLNLGIRIAPGFGKQVSMDTKKSARDGYLGLLSKTANVQEQQFPSTTIRGAGSKPFRARDVYFPEPDDPIDVGPDGELELN